MAIPTHGHDVLDELSDALFHKLTVIEECVQTEQRVRNGRKVDVDLSLRKLGELIMYIHEPLFHIEGYV